MEILNNKEFDVLVDIENNQEELWNRGKSLVRNHINEEEFDEIISKLLDIDFISNIDGYLKLTDKAYVFLEPNRVKSAILLAAGFGSRMQPVTLERPKPLVNVNGEIIIETLIDALYAKGIENITIVTGYLSEKFDDLKNKYPNINYLYNGKYSEENNISSAMLVKNLYCNSYVMDADLLLKNKDIIRKYERYSNYLGIHVDETDDWCLEITDGKVTNMLQGGKDTYLMVGLSYWTKKDGLSFAQDILELYNQEGGKQKYWDDVVLTAFNEHYDISVRPCYFSDIVEIDSIEELASIDPGYKKYIKF